MTQRALPRAFLPPTMARWWSCASNERLADACRRWDARARGHLVFFPVEVEVTACGAGGGGAPGRAVRHTAVHLFLNRHRARVWSARWGIRRRAAHRVLLGEVQWKPGNSAPARATREWIRYRLRR